jgi:hypothetical protein
MERRDDACRFSRASQLPVGALWPGSGRLGLAELGADSMSVQLGDSPPPLPSSITSLPKSDLPSPIGRRFCHQRRCRSWQRTLSYGRFRATGGRAPPAGYSFRWLSLVEKPRLAVLAGTQPRHRTRLDWQRRPPGDAPSVCPCLRVVGDPREPPAQLDSSRELSLQIEDRADRGSIGLGDNEHPNSMAARTAAGNARYYTAFMRDASGHSGLWERSPEVTRHPRHAINCKKGGLGGRSHAQ